MSDDDLPEFDATGAFDDGPWSNPGGCGCLAIGAALILALVSLILHSGEAMLLP